MKVSFFNEWIGVDFGLKGGRPMGFARDHTFAAFAVHGPIDGRLTGNTSN